MRIGIVGAGMAGLSCGAALARAGHDVRLFDKGRGPGGRMSSRRAEVDGQTLSFDHGAQYFTVRDGAFAEAVAGWQQAGVAVPWPEAGSDAWTGTPSMNAPIRAMADTLGVTFGARVEGLSRTAEGWSLAGEGITPEPLDALVIAVPAEQVAPLAHRHDEALARLAGANRSQPCWTVMAAFDEPLPLPGILRNVGPIGWAAREGAKPNRAQAPERWTVQAGPDWSQDHLEDEAETLTALLLEALQQEAGTTLPAPLHTAAHRWRFARSGDAEMGAYWNAELRLGACGDWMAGPRIEDAFLSGQELAKRMLTDG